VRSPLREHPALVRWLPGVAGVLVLLAIVYPEPLLRGAVFGSADSNNALGFTLVGNAALAQRHYPLWNPYLFLGMPTFGSLTYTRFVYPPGEVLTFLQDHLGFPPLTWLLAHLLFGGLGMYWLLGRWRLSTASRLLGAALWLMFPKVTAWAAFGHGSKLATAMYLPWVAGLTLGLLEGRGRRTAPLLALVFGLEVLRGHIQIIYYTGLLVGLLWLGRLIAVWRGSGAARWPDFRRASFLLLASLALAGGIGAILLWPVHEYAGWSVRGAAEGGGAAYEYATGWSLSPREWDTLLLPSAAGFGKATYQGRMPFTDYPNYLGLVAVGLALLGLWRRRDWVTTTLAVTAFVSLLIACGNFFPPLYDLCYRFLPYFNKFRVPSMILTLTGFAVAVLAAVGLDRWRELGARQRAWSGMGLLLVGVLLAAGGLGLARDGYAAHLTALARDGGKPAPAGSLLELAWRLHRADLLRIGLILVALGAWWRFLLPRGGRWRELAPWAVVLLVVVDLATVDRRIVHPERSLHAVARTTQGGGRLVPAPAVLAPRPAATRPGVDPVWQRIAGQAGHERIWPLGGASSTNEGMLAGVRSLGGYHPAKPAAAEEVRRRLFDQRRPSGRLASWLGASLLVTDGPLPENAFPVLAELGAAVDPDPVVGDGLVAYRIRDALPRARLVTRWQRTEAPLSSLLDGIAAGRLRWRDTVRLEAVPDPAPTPVDTVLPPVTYVEDDLDRVTLRTRADVPAILVLADLWLPGWRVTVDGTPAALLRADRLLRAVALPAGEHEVRFVYRDPALHKALPVGGAALLLVLLWLVLGVPAPTRTPHAQEEDRP